MPIGVQRLREPESAGPELRRGHRGPLGRHPQGQQGREHRQRGMLRVVKVAFEQDDAPQLEAFQNRARRAANLSASVLCFK